MRLAHILALAVPLGAAAAPTFHKDVLPILQKNCQSCHRPGEAGPMPFLTYKDTRPWAKAIREAVLLRKMPPWFADPAHGSFQNDRRLSQSDVAKLSAWADGGAPEGNPADLPPALNFAGGWALPVRGAESRRVSMSMSVHAARWKSIDAFCSQCRSINDFRQVKANFAKTLAEASLVKP